LDEALHQTNKSTTDDKVTDLRPASVIARDKMIERNRSAWKGGVK